MELNENIFLMEKYPLSDSPKRPISSVADHMPGTDLRSAVTGLDGSGSGACGRGAERVDSEVRAKLILTHPEDEQPVSIILRDISLNGAGLVHYRNLELGTQLLLQLPSSAGTTLTIRAQVVQSRVLEPGRYRIGVQFNQQDRGVLDRLRDALAL
jgi:hypothetical protein